LAGLKGTVQRVLGRYGLELRRRPGDAGLARMAARDTAGRIIEFIGPGGVGKTTIFAAAAREWGNRWFLPHQALALRLRGPVAA
jgi:MoxR-like ATPase